MFIKYIYRRFFYRFLAFVNNVDLRIQTVQLDMTTYIKMTEWILCKTSFWGSEQFHTLTLFKLFCSDCTPWIRDVKFALLQGYCGSKGLDFLVKQHFTSLDKQQKTSKNTITLILNYITLSSIMSSNSQKEIIIF